MKRRHLGLLAALTAILLTGTRSTAQASTLLVDHFDQDSVLNKDVWTDHSVLLRALAKASSTPPSSFVVPRLGFGDGTGAEMSGPTAEFQTTGLQSLSAFAPPFQVTIDVSAMEGTANPFEVLLVSDNLRQYVTVTANVNPLYIGMYGDAPNIAASTDLGRQFRPRIQPEFGTLYEIVIVIDARGVAAATAKDASGAVLGTVSHMKAGKGPFYLVLGQRIGLAQPAPQVAEWKNVEVVAH